MVLHPSITANLQGAFQHEDDSTLWVDTAGTNDAVVTNPVGRWDDQSGNGRNLTQGTTNRKPIRQSDGLTFPSDDRIENAALGAIASNGADFTLFMVFNPSLLGSDGAVAVFGNNTTEDRYIIFGSDSTGNELGIITVEGASFDENYSTGGQIEDALMTIALICNSGTITLYKNNVQIAQETSANSPTTDRLTIGALNYAGGYYNYGYIDQLQCLYVWDVAMDSADRTTTFNDIDSVYVNPSSSQEVNLSAASLVVSPEELSIAPDSANINLGTPSVLLQAENISVAADQTEVNLGQAQVLLQADNIAITSGQSSINLGSTLIDFVSEQLSVEAGQVEVNLSAVSIATQADEVSISTTSTQVNLNAPEITFVAEEISAIGQIIINLGTASFSLFAEDVDLDTEQTEINLGANDINIQADAPVIETSPIQVNLGAASFLVNTEELDSVEPQQTPINLNIANISPVTEQPSIETGQTEVNLNTASTSFIAEQPSFQPDSAPVNLGAAQISTNAEEPNLTTTNYVNLGPATINTIAEQLSIEVNSAPVNLGANSIKFNAVKFGSVDGGEGGGGNRETNLSMLVEVR